MNLIGLILEQVSKIPPDFKPDPSSGLWKNPAGEYLNPDCPDIISTDINKVKTCPEKEPGEEFVGDILSALFEKARSQSIERILDEIQVDDEVRKLYKRLETGSQDERLAYRILNFVRLFSVVDRPIGVFKFEPGDSGIRVIYYTPDIEEYSNYNYAYTYIKQPFISVTSLRRREQGIKYGFRSVILDFNWNRIKHQDPCSLIMVPEDVYFTSFSPTIFNVVHLEKSDIEKAVEFWTSNESILKVMKKSHLVPIADKERNIKLWFDAGSSIRTTVNIDPQYQDTCHQKTGVVKFVEPKGLRKSLWKELLSLIT